MRLHSLFGVAVGGVGWVVLVAAAVFCLACGLYNAAEWLEDHVRTSFRIIKRATLWSLAVQLTWILLDPSAWIPNMVGIASHTSSWLLLKYHPHHMDDEHMLLAITAVLLLAAHQASWIYWWFLNHGVGWTVTSVLASLVWPVPAMLLLSSASNDSLPVSISQPPAFNMPSSARSPPAAKAYHRHSTVGSDSDVSRTHSRDQHTNGGLAGMLSPWGSHDGQQHHQQQGKKRHRSRVLQGFIWLQKMARRHQLLPITEADAAAGGSPTAALINKLYKD